MRSFGPFALFALVAGLALLAAPPARAGVSLDVGVHVGSPPPPPAYVFDNEPDVVLIPRTRVYYVPGPSYDLFRYGRFWYINNGGWWYRAHNYRGPFRYIAYENVPVTILRVPPKYHRHPLGGPPGHTGMQPGRGHGQERDAVRHREMNRGDRGNDRDHDRGNDNRGDRRETRGRVRYRD